MSSATICADAWLIPLNPDSSTGAPIKLPFRPNQLSLVRSVSWNPSPSPGSNISRLEFGGAGQTTLTLQLFFDTSESGEDVRVRHTDAIYKLTFTDDDQKSAQSKKSQPPGVRFQWGAKLWFDGVIASIGQKFTYFKTDGPPLRATLDLTLEQIWDDQYQPPQNPTSGGVGGEQMWTARQGDTLASIAARALGNPARWRDVADANPLTHSRELRPGQQIFIPSK